MPNQKSGTFDADCQSIFSQLHFRLSPYFLYLLFNFRFHLLTQTAKHVEPNVFCLSEFVKVYLITKKKKTELDRFSMLVYTQIKYILLNALFFG